MTIVFGGVVFYIIFTLHAEQRSIMDFQIKKLLTEKAKMVYNMILEDESPEADSLFDDAWLFAEQNKEISLRDISSYLNPNWVDKEIIVHLNSALLTEPETLFNTEEGSLNDILNDPEDGFLTYREKNGILPDIKHSFSKFFSEEYIDKFFTEYNYFNFNIADQDMQRILYKMRTGSEGDAENFYNNYQQYLISLIPQNNPKGYNKMVDSNSLENWYLSKGPGQEAFNLMFPVHNAEPVMNIHHVPEDILYGILSFPPYKVANPKTAVEKIVQARNSEEQSKTINQGTLGDFFGYGLQYPASKLYQFFGMITWFWEIKVTEGDTTLTWIIARVPPRRWGAPVEFKLIKEEFIVDHTVKPDSEDKDSDVQEEDTTDDTQGELNNTENNDKDDVSEQEPLDEE